MADADSKIDGDTNQDDLFSSLDPETLAPELKKIYKDMQAD